MTFHGLQSLHPARLFLALPRLWCISLNPDNVPPNFTDDAAMLGSQCVRVFRMDLPSGGHYNGPLCGRRPYTPRVQPPLSPRSQPTCQLAPHIRAFIKTNRLAKNWSSLSCAGYDKRYHIYLNYLIVCIYIINTSMYPSADTCFAPRVRLSPNTAEGLSLGARRACR